MNIKTKSLSFCAVETKAKFCTWWMSCNFIFVQILMKKSQMSLCQNCVLDGDLGCVVWCTVHCAELASNWELLDNRRIVARHKGLNLMMICRCDCLTVLSTQLQVSDSATTLSSNWCYMLYPALNYCFLEAFVKIYIFFIYVLVWESVWSFLLVGFLLSISFA